MMPGYLSLSFKSLASSATRWVFTLVALALGVGGIIATLSINNALSASLDKTARELLGNGDAELVAIDERGLSQNALDTLSHLQQVEQAVPRIVKLTYFRSTGSQGFLKLTGIDPQLDAAVHPMTVAQGRGFTAGSDEGLLVPGAWADGSGLKLNDSISLITADGFRTFKIKAFVDGVETLGLGSQPAAFVTLDTMRKYFALGARVGQVSLRYAPGMAAGAPQKIAEAIHEPYELRDLPGMRETLASGQWGFRWLLLLFGVVALIGGGAQILNTLAVLAARRSREFALMRAAGATRRQVTIMLVVEGLSAGVIGSLAGVAVGWLVASILGGLVQSGRGLKLDVGLDLSSALLGSFAGIFVSLVASLVPALTIGTRGPLDTLRREGPAAPVARSFRVMAAFVVLLLMLLGLGIWALLSQGSEAQPFLLLGTFLIVLFLGLLLLLFAALPLLIRLAGVFLRHSGLEVLAQSSLRWHSDRTALTATALTISVAMLTTLLVLVSSAATTGSNATSTLFAAPYVVVAPVPQPALIMQQVGIESNAAAISPLRKLTLSWEGRFVEAVALDPSFYAQEPDSLALVGGDRNAQLTALESGDALLVPVDFARRNQVQVGDTMGIWTPDSGYVPFKIVGLLERSFPSADSSGTLVLSTATLKNRFGIDSFTQLLVRPSGEDFSARLQSAAERYGLQARSAADLAADIQRTITETLLLFGGLIGVAALIGALSIVNAMMLNVMERAHVIGLLRAAGMTTRQVAMLVVIEGMLIGLLAGLLGVVLGTGVGGLLFTTGRISQDTTFSPPIWIVLLIPATVLLTAVASLYPARQAAVTATLRSIRNPRLD
jgi:putative ABC transport system permease protein